MKKELPSLMRRTVIPTDSSVLVSSSKYLNNPRLRDWVATQYLRRSGADHPTPVEAVELNGILAEIQDKGRIDELFARERRINPALDRWLGERFVSTFTERDLEALPADSLGGLFYRKVVRSGYHIALVPVPDPLPSSDFDFWMLRAAQTHDFEHIVGGAGLDFIAELVPYYMRLTNIFKFISPELAGELSVFISLASTRIMTRAVLHYPEVWLTVLATAERGAHVGRSSEPLFSAKYEDAWHLPLEAARAALGVRGAVDVDTAAATAIYEERVGRDGARAPAGE